MTLTAEERESIINYRIERAYSSLQEAEYVAKGNFWNLTANRLYYSLFYMCEALLLSHGISAHTHSGVSRMISLHYINKGILDKQDSKLIGNIFRMRISGDYDDCMDWTEEDVLPKIPEVKDLLDKMVKLI